jgi:membrane-associated phospholipid phosphatase
LDMATREQDRPIFELPDIRLSASDVHGGRCSIYVAAITLATLTSFALFTLAFAPSGWPMLDHGASRFTAYVVRGPIEILQAKVYLLGVPSVSFLLAALLGVAVLRCQGMRAALLALGTLGLMAIFEGALRIRLAGLPWNDPSALFGPEHVWHVVDSTYPSGHTARVLATAGIAAFLLPRRLPAMGFIAALLLGGLMALQRIHAGQHSGSDVVGGFLLGAGMATFFGALLPWVSRPSAEQFRRSR